LGSVALPAFAQDSATASALFDKALADMEAGRFEQACPAFAESYRLDPQAGALFTLAECEAKWGKFASAITHYGDYLQVFDRMSGVQRAAQRGRETIAAEQKKALYSSVPNLTLTLPPDAPEGTVVRRDNIILNGPALGLALPVDPGDHVVEVRLPTGQVSTEKLSLVAGQQLQVLLTLPTVPVPVAPASASASVPLSASASPPPAPAPVPNDEPRTTAWIIGGAGIVALGVGSYFGMRAFSKWNDAKSLCNDSKCPSQSNSLKSDAESAAMISNVGIGLGVIGIGLGSYLLFRPSSSESNQAEQSKVRVVPIVGARAAAISVGGAF
jgi:hypothetical protein